MGNDPSEYSIPTTTISKMVRAINSSWNICEHTSAKGGYLPVQLLRLDTPTGTKSAVLKASADGDRHGIDTEARILRLLGAHSSIPVPDVYGVVDEHIQLTAPFFLMEYVPGTTIERTELHAVSQERLQKIARVSGRYIAELHRLDAFESYGFLKRNPEMTLRGERPPATFDQIVVTDPTTSWQAQIRTWKEGTLAGVRDSRFADLVPKIEPVLDEQIDQLEGSFEPVLGHIDNSIENVRHDPDTGEITALLDWAFSLSVTSGYDLVLIEESLNGGQWRLLPESPDYTETIRPALLDGYCEIRSESVRDELERHRELYELLSLARSMNNLSLWLGFQDAAPEQIDAAAQTVRQSAGTYL